MKRIIEIEESIYQGIINGKKADRSVEPREIVRSFQATIADAIAQSTPYNPTGDCISREALKDITYINKGNFNTVEGIREWIDNAPPVDLWQMRQEATENALKKAEVLYGRPKRKWIECRSSDHWKCDECGHPAPLESRDCEWLSNFCPNCGADMRKGGADNEKTDK